MRKGICAAAGLAVISCLAHPVNAQQSKNPNIVKVLCRDMGDGRILIDSGYLPDWANSDKFGYDIIAKGATSMKGEWANLVCTLRIKARK
jgi:hypothetical protein